MRIAKAGFPVPAPPCRPLVYRTIWRHPSAMSRSLTLAAVPLLWLAAALPAAAQEPPGVVHFSAGKAGSLPSGWESVKITDQKKPTEYKLVENDGHVVLAAKADGAATGLAQRIPIDVDKWPVVAWRWKISRLITAADNSKSGTEDSPVRLVFEFDGDKKKLTFSERAAFSLAESISGRESPYASMMYIWSNKVPAGTVIPNPRTNRVQMVVASTGPGGVGAWQSLSRNVREDYKRAFGEDPGKLIAYGVLTDTDNTGESVEAWYGDIVFKPRAP